MENLFSFDYQETPILNLDSSFTKDGENSQSRFSIIYGDKGQVIHTKKDSYKIVPTLDLSSIGHAFIDKGFGVKTFTHTHGEVIGLDITLGERPTKVGDKVISAYITLPNNGGGRGYTNLHEKRLVCLNGAMRTIEKHKTSIKIPHTVDYKTSLLLMQEALLQFQEIATISEQMDLDLADQKLKSDEVMFILNSWFYHTEMPTNHKKDFTFEQFRKAIYGNPESIEKSSVTRWNQLREAYQREIGYNTELGLDLSKYTAFAVVSNYLTRREEASRSSAPKQVQNQIAGVKLNELVLSLV